MACVQDDVCPLRHPVAIYNVIRQGSTHGEVYHRVEAQAFIDEALQHLQLLKVPVLKLSLTFNTTVMRYQGDMLRLSETEHRNCHESRIKHQEKAPGLNYILSCTASVNLSSTCLQLCLSPAAAAAPHLDSV